jgi:hypothetical protein
MIERAIRQAICFLPKKPTGDQACDPTGDLLLAKEANR